jgi:hypothetical protein
MVELDGIAELDGTTLWQLTPDGLRQIDLDGKRVRRIEGINLPTESEGRDGSWHDYAKLSGPLRVGEAIEVVWATPGRSRETLRSMTTTVTVALLEQPPAGPWRWGFGDEAGQSGLVSLGGEPVAQTVGIEIAFLLAHLLNAAEGERLATGALRRPSAVSAVRIGDQGQRAVVVSGVVLCTVGGTIGAERLLTDLGRWSAASDVLEVLVGVAGDLGAWKMVAVWDLLDPSASRDAVLAGGIAASSGSGLDAAGPESFRHVARLAGQLGEILSWPEALSALDTASAGAASVVELVTRGELDSAEVRVAEIRAAQPSTR